MLTTRIKITVLLFTCMSDLDLKWRIGFGTADLILFTISQATTSAWGIFTWVHAVPGCGSVKTVMILFRWTVSFNDLRLQGFGLFFFGYVGFLAILEPVYWAVG
jgi:hypothetical protein